MKITVFEGQNLDELSMIEVAHALLEQTGKEMEFANLVNTIQDYLGKSDEEIRSRLSRFYTELNTDGSFIPLGNNVWGLRSWYAIDEIDEEVVALDEVDDEGERPLKKRRKVNAFAVGTDDIDYTDDDPEDESYEPEVEDMDYDDNPDDEKAEVEAYDAELAEVVVDSEDDVELDEEDDEFSDDEEDK